MRDELADVLDENVNLNARLAVVRRQRDDALREAQAALEVAEGFKQQAAKWERAAGMWQLAYDSAQACANDAVHHAAEVTRFLSTVTLEDLPQ